MANAQLSLVQSQEEIPKISWDEEIKNPGSNVRGVIQRAAFLIYAKTGCEDAERNWYNASSFFLKNYAGKYQGFTIDKSLEQNTTDKLNFEAHQFYRGRLDRVVTGNGTISDEEFARYDWDKAVNSIAKSVFREYIESLKYD